MASHRELVDRFLEQAFEDKPRFLGKLKPGGSPLGIRTAVFRKDGREFHALLSYPTPGRPPFPILVAIPEQRLFLLNGDAAGMSEAHQAFVRTAIQGPSSRWHRQKVEAPKKDIPHVILPFSALDPAGIHYDSIETIDVLPDRWVAEPRSSENWEDMPWESRHVSVKTHEPLRRAPGEYNSSNCPTCGNWSCNGTTQVKVERAEDGFYHWEQDVHFLGASVFRARYGEANETATFLSAFDADEPHPLYFLAQLPKEVGSYDDALEALKPMEVKKAEANDIPVLRQGDMFFIRTELTTDWLRRHGKMTLRVARTIEMDRQDGTSFTKRLEEANRIWGTAHTASAMVELPSGELYVRGQIRHRPEGRMRDHRDVVVGTAWHQVARNTVPLQNVPGVMAPRAWSLSGRVD